jgi:hypothetical protein
MWQAWFIRYNAITRVRPNALIVGLCIGFVLAVLVVSGFFGRPSPSALPAPPPADTPLARRIFTLGATSFAIDLPEASEIRDFGDPSDVTIYDFTRGKRLQRQIRIATASREPGANYDRQMAIAGSGHLEYQVTDNIGGGSGGPIGELTGRLKIGSRVLFIECTDQDGLGYTHPDWCLRYLDRLEIVQRGP